MIKRKTAYMRLPCRTFLAFGETMSECYMKLDKSDQLRFSVNIYSIALIYCIETSDNSHVGDPFSEYTEYNTLVGRNGERMLYCRSESITDAIKLWQLSHKID